MVGCRHSEAVTLAEAAGLAPQDQVTTWLNQVRQLQSVAIAPNPEGIELRRCFGLVQQLAQQQILTLQPIVTPQARSFSPVAFQTEISRTLRLVAIDIQFLAMARQSLKRQARQEQLSDRLIQLLHQGQGLLQALAGEEQDRGQDWGQ